MNQRALQHGVREVLRGATDPWTQQGILLQGPSCAVTAVVCFGTIHDHDRTTLILYTRT